MKNLSFWSALLLLVTFTSCDYDDSGLWNSLNGIEERVAALEATVGKLNGDLAAMRTLVDKLDKNVYVSKIVRNADGSHTIFFTDNQQIVITDGKDGSDAPVIGIKADEEGRYCWTLTVDGRTEWLRSADGELLPVSGESGITPQIKVDEQGFWIVSYDGWTSRQHILDEAGNPVSAVGETTVADSFFRDVEDDAENVYFTLMDGTVITLAKRSDFYLLVRLAPVRATFAYGETKRYEVESKGVADVVLTKPFGWKAVCAEGELSVTAPAEGDACEAEGEVSIIYFSDDDRSSVIKMGVAIDKDYTGVTAGEDFTVTITAITDTKIVADVVPADPQMAYYIYPNRASQTDEECISQMLKRFKADVEYGDPIDYIHTGTTSGYVYNGLSAGYEFTLSVIGVKYDAAAKTLEALSPPVTMRVPFVTNAPEIIDTRYLMTLTDVSWYGATCAIHPSDDRPYFHAFVKKSELDAAYDDAEFAQDFIDNRYYYPYFDEVFDYGWSAFTVHGDRTLASPGFLLREPYYISEDIYPLEPDTEYYAVALGCDERGEFSNARIGRKLFRTKPFVAAEKCTFTIETSVDRQNIAVTVTPSDNSVTYISFIDERDNYSRNFAQPLQYPPYDLYYRLLNLKENETIGDSADFYAGKAVYTVVDLKASTAYIVYAYGCTADGVITTAPEIVEVLTRGTIDRTSAPAPHKHTRPLHGTYRVIRK